MNRKLILLLLVIVLIVSSISSVVLGDVTGEDRKGLGNILETFEKIFGFIPETLEGIWGGDATSLFLAKFLIWIMLYSIIYYGLGFIFAKGGYGTKGQKGIRITISFVIAILGSVLIPADIIINIFMTYMVIGSVIVLAIPFLFGWYMISKLPDEKGYNYIRAFIYVLLIFMTYTIMDSLDTIAGQHAKAAVSSIATVTTFFYLFMAVAVIGLISNLFRGATGKGLSDHISDLSSKSGFSDWLSKAEKEEEVLTRDTEVELTEAERELAVYTKNAPPKVKKYAVELYKQILNVLGLVKRADLEFGEAEKEFGDMEKLVAAGKTDDADKRLVAFKAKKGASLAASAELIDEDLNNSMKIIRAKLATLKNKLPKGDDYIIKAIVHVTTAIENETVLKKKIDRMKNLVK